MIRNEVRQGDVLLVPVSADSYTKSRKLEVPDQREPNRIVLAYGEATGHAHAIRSDKTTLWGDELSNRFLEVVEGTELRHEHLGNLIEDEHAVVPIAPGHYKVVQQQEWTPFGWREVRD